MLEGITILNQTEIWNNTPLFNIFLFIIAISGIITIVLLTNNFVIHGIISGLILIILIIILACIPNKYKSTFKGNSYEVIIDDSVSINEVADQFIIKEHRGDIWILEDKNSKERE